MIKTKAFLNRLRQLISRKISKVRLYGKIIFNEDFSCFKLRLLNLIKCLINVVLMVASQTRNQKSKMCMSQCLDFLLNPRIVSYGIKSFQILCLQTLSEFVLSTGQKMPN